MLITKLIVLGLFSTKMEKDLKHSFQSEGSRGFACPKSSGRNAESENHGFVFREECQKGYYRTYSRTFSQFKVARPAYASYSVDVGEFNGVPGEDLIVGIPRGQNDFGDLVGKVTKQSPLQRYKYDEAFDVVYVFRRSYARLLGNF